MKTSTQLIFVAGTPVPQRQARQLLSAALLHLGCLTNVAESARGRNQFRPDTLPIVGAQLRTGYFTIRGTFDLDAAIGRNRPLRVRPLVNQHWSDGKLCRQLALGLPRLDVVE